MSLASRSFLIAIFWVLWAGSAAAEAVIVRHDPGGNILERALQVQQMIQQGQTPHIVADCWSSCTMLLAVPGVCVSPRAQLGFHGPSVAGRQIDTASFELMSALMANHYPAAIRAPFLSEWRHSQDFVVISGRSLIAAGIAAC